MSVQLAKKSSSRLEEKTEGVRDVLCVPEKRTKNRRFGKPYKIHMFTGPPLFPVRETRYKPTLEQQQVFSDL